MALTLSAALAAQQGPRKQALAELVRIPSVCDESDPRHPLGPLLPDEQITEHQPNERVVLVNLSKAMEIDAHAVYELTR